MGRFSMQLVLSQDKELLHSLRNPSSFRDSLRSTRSRRCSRFARNHCAVLILLISAACVAAGPSLRIGFNLSRSAPRGLYRVVADAPTRSAFVIACLPASVAAFGRVRGYLGAGACPDGAQPVLKSVGALADDVVEIRPGAIRVNGIELSARSVELLDSAARPLPHVDFGAYRVAAGEIWLFGLSHSRSWDSRYFGPIPIAAVRSTVRPVLTVD